ncbi:hypothetical protein Leryth_011981 [Lithospermum erythrorhizon]|nr:hypothetical protein Leryth_011981 [Lithospermum erythrorhizon]
MSISHQPSTRYNTSMLTPRLLLISATIISASIAVKLYAPPLINISSSVPTLYVVSWLKPPYLYLIINFIIITIVASTKLQSKFEHFSSSQVHESFVQVQPISKTVQIDDVFANNSNINDVVLMKNDQLISAEIATSSPPPQFNEVFSYNSNDVVLLKNGQPLHMAEPPLAQPLEAPVVEKIGVFGHLDARVSETETEFTVDTGGGGEIDEVVISKSGWSTPVSHRVTAEKPPVSTRFGHHRRIVKAASPEGGKTALRVSKPKKQDTLESTWKTITEGRPMPLTRHLKKSDTWETHGRHHHHNLDNDVQKMIKSETFSERSETTPPLRRTHTPGKLKKEPSLGQDELNKRVEAFIKKFNEEMRLQRQESLNKYKEMISRGAH